MRIAVCYQEGKVFPHFGRTETFKLYETEDRKILSASMLSAGGAGHEALAEVLEEAGVEVIICGGCGSGAEEALTDAGIRVISGAEGDADEAVEAFLAGQLESQGVNCHHEEEEEGCHCGGGCSGSCGSCGGCQPRILLEGPNAGKTVSVHYRGTFNDGTQFDASYDRDEPLEFICGAGMMIPGFDKAVVDMKVGESVDIHLMPEDAYGPVDPEQIFTLPISQLQGAEMLNPGERVFLTNNRGQSFPVTVTAKTETMITLDTNHEMAGKELNFHIELLSVKD